MYKFNTNPKNEEELNEFFVTLNQKAQELGVGLDFTRKDVRDAEHLNCVCCGENITAEDVKYLWFKAINS